MVITPDFESGDLSSNLGGTFFIFLFLQGIWLVSLDDPMERRDDRRGPDGGGQRHRAGGTFLPLQLQVAHQVARSDRATDQPGGALGGVRDDPAATPLFPSPFHEPVVSHRPAGVASLVGGHAIRFGAVRDCRGRKVSGRIHARRGFLPEAGPSRLIRLGG